MQTVHGAPYVPGRAVGAVRFGLTGHSGAIGIVAGTEVSEVAPDFAGIIVVDGAPLSHAMLRLFSMGFPVVLLDAAQAATLTEDARVLIDGGTGLIRNAEPDECPEALRPPAFAGPVSTADGIPIELRASVPGAEGAALARSRGASAIGLLRSECLVPGNGSVPDEPFYRAALGKVCKAADPLSVTVRLGDFGASKRPRWLPPGPGGLPFGFQGVRWFDREPVRSVIRAQVKAAAGLASDFELRLLLPFVTAAEECIRWRKWIDELSPVPMAVGAMAETPAAVLAMPELLDAADFVAIGCNDLLQGLFEADRDLPELRAWLDPYAPCAFRILRLAAEAAGDRLDRVQLCGLLPQLPCVLPTLIGLGFRTFSVEPVLLPWLAADVARVRGDAAAALAEAVCAAPDGAAVRRLLELESSSAWGPGALVHQ